MGRWGAFKTTSVKALELYCSRTRLQGPFEKPDGLSADGCRKLQRCRLEPMSFYVCSPKPDQRGSDTSLLICIEFTEWPFCLHV